MLGKWHTVSKELVGDLKIFKHFDVIRKNPDGDKEGTFTVLESNNWVNVIPITPEGKIVCVKQYRHGTDSIVLELPGGMIEENEYPGSAAERECKEETGYISSKPLEFLGETYPNPAFMTNRCYTFIWEGCELRYQQFLDTFEEIEIVEVSINEMKIMLDRGQIRHGVILNALLMFFSKKGHKWLE